MTRADYFRKVRTGAWMARWLPAFLTLGLLRYVVPIETMARLTWRRPQGTPRDPALEARALNSVIGLSKRLAIADRNCLQRSLTLYRALSRYGAHPELWIGFHRRDQKVEGHAWIVVDGRPLAEPADLIASLVPTCGFGERGQVLYPPKPSA